MARGVIINMKKDTEDFFNALAHLEQLGILNIIQDGDTDFLVELSEDAKKALGKGDIK